MVTKWYTETKRYTKWEGGRLCATDRSSLSVSEAYYKQKDNRNVREMCSGIVNPYRSYKKRIDEIIVEEMLNVE